MQAMAVPDSATLYCTTTVNVVLVETPDPAAVTNSWYVPAGVPVVPPPPGGGLEPPPPPPVPPPLAHPAIRMASRVAVKRAAGIRRHLWNATVSEMSANSSVQSEIEGLNGPGRLSSRSNPGMMPLVWATVVSVTVTVVGVPLNVTGFGDTAQVAFGIAVTGVRIPARAPRPPWVCQGSSNPACCTPAHAPARSFRMERSSTRAVGPQMETAQIRRKYTTRRN
jgi:hypothetical protein